MIQIGKTQAASQQIVEAARLFFEERDPVSIHTLVAASHGILRDLLLKKGDRSFLKDSPYIREDKRTEFRRIINRAQNFFKHANRDPEESLQFDPASTKFLLLDGIEMFYRLYDVRPLELEFFRVWFVAAHPQFLLDGPLKDQVAPLLATPGFDPNDFKAIRAFLAQLTRGMKGPGT